MLRRINIALLALATSVGWLMIDSQDCHAQRILRRIQSRLPQRLLPLRVIPTNPALAPLDAETEPQQQQQEPLRRQPLLRIQPQRVSPIQQQADPAADAAMGEGNSASTDPETYGRSVLVPADPKAAENQLAPPANPVSLGIRVVPSRDGIPGLQVADFRSHSLADEAGLRTGDVIVAINGNPTPTVAEIARELQGRKAGDQIEASIVRNNNTGELTIPLVQRPTPGAAPAPDRSAVAQASAIEPVREPETAPATPVTPAVTATPKLAPAPVPATTETAPTVVTIETPTEPAASELLAEPTEPVLAEPTEPVLAEPTSPRPQPAGPVALGVDVANSPQYRGVIVTNVASNSPASVAGLQVGDRIVSLDGQLMLDRSVLDRSLAQKSAGDEFSLQVIRDGALVAADVTLSRPTAALDSDTVTEEKKAVGGSVLEGFGSVLGGLLGEKSNPAVDPKAAVGTATSDDEMAFGDGEPIGQVVFEEEVQRAIDELQGDPPSVEALQPPPSEKPIELKRPVRDEASLEALREEIRRLEQRLKELEEKS